MQWWQFASCGALGGALVEVLALYGCVLDWKEARRTASGRIKKKPTRIREFVDVPAHAWILALRVILGGIAATIFAISDQITGPYVAVALGFSAPAVLAQLGSVPQIAKAVAGTPTENERPPAEVLETDADQGTPESLSNAGPVRRPEVEVDR